MAWNPFWFVSNSKMKKTSSDTLPSITFILNIVLHYKIWTGLIDYDVSAVFLSWHFLCCSFADAGNSVITGGRRGVTPPRNGIIWVASNVMHRQTKHQRIRGNSATLMAKFASLPATWAEKVIWIPCLKIDTLSRSPPALPHGLAIGFYHSKQTNKANVWRFW